MLRWIAAALIAPAALATTVLAQPARDKREPVAPARAAPITTVDRLIPHISMVPAVAGRKVDLFVREKAPVDVVEGRETKPLAGRVVLFIHGAYATSTLAYDVPYRDYSWMEYLAKAGLDVFAMDMTGYGRSTRPLMDDPCNVDPRQQTLLIPRTLQQPCPLKYPFELVNTDSETSDIGAVVDYIRKLRNVERVSLVGWAAGGMRAAIYAARNPDRVDRLVIHAASNYDRNGPDKPPEKMPKPGVPMTFQGREVAEDVRWLNGVTCPDQVEPGMPDVIWKLSLDADPVGATWGPGGLRAPTRTMWGWNQTTAKSIKAPTLVVAGEQDQLAPANLRLYEDLGATSKVYLSITCATHYVEWERQSRVLRKASLDWLRAGSIASLTAGTALADAAGAIVPSEVVAAVPHPGGGRKLGQPPRPRP